MKAGGIFTLLDTSHPKARLQTIVQLVNCQLILSSAACQNLAIQLAEQCLVVGYDVISQLPAPETLPKGCPQERLYIVFTSGSTGTPKGAIITHTNFCSAVKHQAESLCYFQTTRVFDFAAYCFDIAVSNVLHCLAAGGCLCIPSNADRKQDLPGAMEKMRVNLIDLMPSVARTIDPKSVPSLKALVLGGETATRADFVRWAPYVHILNGIGQAECTVTTTMAAMDPAISGTPGIGKGLGANTWIVDPQDHCQLVAIGAIGELLVEGPLVGEGYLNDKGMTSEFFIRDPAWLVKGPPDGHLPGRSGRLYKTGDLVRYDANGSLLFMGRKGAQTKIRGQRVELEDIEHHVSRLLQAKGLALDLVAEVITSREASSSVLVIFVRPPDTIVFEKDKSDGFQVTDSKFLPDAFGQLNDQLAKELPVAMIPFSYVPISSIPLAPTGKTDRKKLKLVGTNFTIKELANFDVRPRKPKCLPSTSVERQLQNLWAMILGANADSIGTNNDFLQLGGDSISAMRLAGLAREHGLYLTAMDVLSQSRLRDLAKVARIYTNETGNGNVIAEATPFSMLQTDDVKRYLKEHVLPFLEYPVDSIEDVFPVTEFQAECIRGALHKPPRLCNYFFIDLDSRIDTTRLQDSCQALAQHLPILRTVFIQHGKSFLQVVTKGKRPGFQRYNIADDDLPAASEILCQKDWQTLELNLGSQFSHFMLVINHSQKKIRLIIRLSHAQYDGISLDPMMETLAAAYQGISLPCLGSFASFVKHTITKLELSLEYWRRILSGSLMTRICNLGSNSAVSDSQNRPYAINGSVKKSRESLPKGATLATALTACWAATLAFYTQKNDVVFGRLVAGRASSVTSDFSSVMGPCLNVVPVRIRWKVDESPLPRPEDAFTSIQQQQVEAMAFETTGLSNIVESCTNWPVDTEFDSVFQYQNIGETNDVVLADNKFSLDVMRLDFWPKQLWLLVKPRGEEVYIQLFGTTAMMERKAAKMLLDSFCGYVADLNSA